MKGPIPDCRTCGACCGPLQDQAEFCDLTEKEACSFSPQFRTANIIELPLINRLTRGYPAYALKTRYLLAKSGPFKGISFCSCVMLEGSPMHRVRCRIYERRPSVCRKSVKPGDRTCLQVRMLLHEAAERLNDG